MPCTLLPEGAAPKVRLAVRPVRGRSFVRGTDATYFCVSIGAQSAEKSEFQPRTAFIRPWSTSSLQMAHDRSSPRPLERRLHMACHAVPARSSRRTHGHSYPDANPGTCASDWSSAQLPYSPGPQRTRADGDVVIACTLAAEDTPYESQQWWGRGFCRGAPTAPAPSLWSFGPLSHAHMAVHIPLSFALRSASCDAEKLRR